jgi:hypothetical protein
MTQSHTMWRLLDSVGKSEDGADTLTLTLQSKGEVYVVAIVGGKGMSITTIGNAFRAATNYLLKASGAPMLEGARDATSDEIKDSKKCLN